MIKTARQMTVKAVRAAFGAAVLLAPILLTACREEPAAKRSDLEIDNLYGRMQTIHTAYASIQRGEKSDRLPLEHVAAPAPGEPPKPVEATVQTAALFSAPPSVMVPRRPMTRLIAFDTAPFPYDGTIGRTDRPFYNVEENGRRGHRTPFNRVYWENETYNDPRVLLHIPRGFDIRKPGVMVLFFHGHGAELERDVVRRQQVPKQVSESGANAVLVAPQLAVDARDSSIGKLWEPGGVRRFLDEAAGKLAQLYGHSGMKTAFVKMPVVIIAYSGGYIPAAWTISTGGLGKRLKGVVLLDALYGETEKFTSWITNRRTGFFVSAYANSTRAHNHDFEKMLTQLNIPVHDQLGSALGHGSVVFISTDPDTLHRDFVTKAWVDYPIKDLLERMNFVEHASL